MRFKLVICLQGQSRVAGLARRDRAGHFRAMHPLFTVGYEAITRDIAKDRKAALLCFEADQGSC